MWMRIGEDVIDDGRAALLPQPYAICHHDDEGVSDPRGRAGTAIRGQTGGRSRPALGNGAIPIARAGGTRRRPRSPPQLRDRFAA